MSETDHLRRRSLGQGEPRTEITGLHIARSGVKLFAVLFAAGVTPFIAWQRGDEEAETFRKLAHQALEHYWEETR